MTLRIATYNIRCGIAPDGPNAWPKRKHLTAQMVASMAADIVCLQEAYDFQIADLIHSLPEFEWIGVGREDGFSGGEHPAVLYRPDKATLEKWTTFWFSDTPDVPGSKHWGNDNVRSCTAAQFAGFDLFNLHIDHDSQISRLKSVELLTTRFRKGVPTLVTGDFNVHEDNPVIEMMRQAGFRDSFRMVHPDRAFIGTYNDWKEELEERKIDYVFVSPEWTVVDAEIEGQKLDGRWPSDHAPVWASLTL